MKTVIILASLLVSSLFINAQSSARDKKFIEEAVQGNLLEMKLGELAQAKATSADVKSLGQQMIADHSKSNTALIALAARQNITIAATLNAKGQSTYEMLASKQSEDFDKAYTKSMISDHKKDLCLFKKEAKKGDDIDLKGFASASVPVLQHHKQMAKDARKALNKNKTGQTNVKSAAITTN